MRALHADLVAPVFTYFHRGRDFLAAVNDGLLAVEPLFRPVVIWGQAASGLLQSFPALTHINVDLVVDWSILLAID